MSDERTTDIHNIGQFGTDDLRLVGGDYGQLHVEAVSEANRVFLDAFVDAARRGNCGARIVALVIEYDSKAPVFEERHAGVESQPRYDEAGALVGSEDPKSSTAGGPGERDAAGDQ